jgi:hypothetical protein
LSKAYRHKALKIFGKKNHAPLASLDMHAFFLRGLITILHHAPGKGRLIHGHAGLLLSLQTVLAENIKKPCIHSVSCPVRVVGIKSNIH